MLHFLCEDTDCARCHGHKVQINRALDDDWVIVLLPAEERGVTTMAICPACKRDLADIMGSSDDPW
jgi:hypothetical protein